jgi:hypothetical protein
MATCMDEGPSLSAPTRRKLTLFDLLTLIAATAVGLALLRVSIDGMEDRVMAKSPGTLIQSRITACRTYASCFLAPWSVAILVLKLRTPRASSQRMEREPGFIACVAANSGVALYVILCLIQFAMGKLLFTPFAISRITWSLVNYAALMVTGAWLSLVLDSRWRSETDWVGVAGRIVGISWIGVFLLGWIRVVF